MKKTVTLIMLSLTSISLGQSLSTPVLDYNNVSARLNDGGVLFNNWVENGPGYEVPRGGGAHSIYATAFWFGGNDVNGQLKLSGQRFQPLKDLFPGPLTIGTANPPAQGTWNNTIPLVRRQQIDAHIQNNLNPQPGYVVPSSFLLWPAHGDVTQGFAANLAPFVDVDNDGVYDPSNGDYPCIKGDEAAYIIMNDKGGAHTETGGDPIGLEVHVMVYQYVTSDFLNDITFINTKMINRGTQTIVDFRFGTFVDADLGYFGDDYMGCDSTRNLTYVYNGDAFDESNGSSPGYGEIPPAIGLLSLNHELASAVYFTIGTSFPYADPTNAAEYYNFLSGKWANGDDMVYGGLGYAGSTGATSSPTKFMFTGDPVTQQGWSEVTNNNPTGDRRMLSTLGLGQFAPNDELVSDMAVVYARSEDSLTNFASVETLRIVSDSVQEFYDAQTDVCEGALGTSTLNLVDFALYPNPSSGIFVLEMEKYTGKSFRVTDITGREVMSDTPIIQSHTTIKIQEEAGIYLIHCTDGTNTSVRRMIIK